MYVNINSDSDIDNHYNQSQEDYDWYDEIENNPERPDVQIEENKVKPYRPEDDPNHPDYIPF